MSKREYRRFTAEQKLEILREADQPGMTVSEVCRCHGLSPSVLYRWRAVAQGGAVIKTHNLIGIKTNDYGSNYLQAEAIIAKLMHHYNEERLHAALGYMTPATWHRGEPNDVRDERARRIAAARAHRRMTNQLRFTQAA